MTYKIRLVIVPVVTLLVLTLLHKDVADEVEHLIARLHLNPAGHVSQSILRAANNITDAKLVTAALGAVTYSTVRFVEAYGLWKARTWAQMFAILSGALYLPWEIHAAVVRPSALHLGLVIGNLIIVLYMLYIRLSEMRRLG